MPSIDSKDTQMGSSLSRWLVGACWLLALLAALSAANKGSLWVGALWALPGAMVVTLAVASWPRQTVTRNLAVLGVVWQVALIGAYWPFSLQPNALALAAPTTWPLHTTLIGVVLALLLMGFLSAFLWPALALRARLARAARTVQAQREQALDAVGQIFRGDIGLLRCWQEYLNQVRTTPDADGRPREFALASAAAVFDPHLLTQSRLRLDFFKNLPGMLTGLGIIGTFSGLIMGLREFRISQEPGVVQASLEALLGGVWEAFVASALAISLAIVVTLIEKLALSGIARQADALAHALDGVYPPRPQPDSDAWASRLLEALQHLSVLPDALRRAHAEPMPAPGTPARPASAEAPPPPAPAPLPDWAPALQQMSQHAQLTNQALGALAQQLPDLLGRQQQQTQQALAQSMQVMKTLAGRLEGVASSIELSGRKTLETVAARLMQSEMNMLSRHQAVAGHLAELVQRIETLCALLQTDRNDLLSNHSHGSGESAMGPAWPLREDPYREPRAGHTGQPAAAAGDGGLAGPHGYGKADAFGAIDEGFGADGWGEPLPQPARFGA
jgi:hypothetical protein